MEHRVHITYSYPEGARMAEGEAEVLLAAWENLMPSGGAVVSHDLERGTVTVTVALVADSPSQAMVEVVQHKEGMVLRHLKDTGAATVANSVRHVALVANEVGFEDHPQARSLVG